jgi:D-3-phosphoglycerate dehydrogenase
VNPRILVTPRSLTAERHPYVEALSARGYDVIYCTPGATPSEAELLELAPGCVGWLAGVEPVSPRVIEAAQKLVVISRNGVGVDNLPVDVLARKGVKVMVANGANALGVAELTIGLVFSALRSIPLADAGIKSGGWPRVRGREIHGRTVGLVGCGAVGRQVARMVVGLGARIVAFDPARPDLDLPSSSFFYAELPEILRSADVVSLHCPLPKGGRALLGKSELPTLKPGAVLINTARARLIDEEALIEALDDGRVSCYATDVFEAEPPASLRLASHRRVIATSHIGGFTEESVDRATRIAVDNLLLALQEGKDR